MGLLDWIKPQGASLDELAAQLNAAQTLHGEAARATQAALTKFDADGSDTSAKALAKAREAEAMAREHTDRAQRLLTTAREAQEQQRLAALRQSRSEGAVELSHTALAEVRAAGVKAEVKACLALAAVHARRTTLELELLNKQQAHNQLCHQLGEPLCANVQGIDPDRFAVAMALADHLHSLADDDLARPFLQRLLLPAYGGIPMTWTPPAQRQAAQ